MSIEPGQRLLHYEIVEKIGEGGMGIVWSARDTKLERQVAIKILPDEFSSDEQRLARFEREAKMLATLNHPNVAGIHGFEQADGVHFLVLELIEGETLQQMLERGRLPIEDALETCRQVAEGLEAAHQSGVIHRDLKPGNIKVTPDGKAKVLDFGLAKGVAGSAGSSIDLSMSPTVTVAADTQAGVVLGTAPYMSPEQARGKPMDRRTDIWSFGCVLFECLSGRPVFSGETVTDVLSAILQREPEWGALHERTPPRVRDLIERCLERSLRNRSHDISDARIVLGKSIAIREWTTSGIAAAPGLPGAATRAGVPRWAWLAVGLFVGAAIVLPAYWMKPFGTEPPLRKFTFTFQTDDPRPEISPDGTRIAYIQDDRLWIRDLDQMEAREVTGGDGVLAHGWSPDSQWLAISKGRQLWKLPAGGGAPVFLTDVRVPVSTVESAGGVTWSSDGRVVYNEGDAGLMAVSEQGGVAVSIAEPGEGEQDFHTVEALPEGKGFLFAVHHDDAMDTLAVLTDSGRKDVLKLPGRFVGVPVFSLSGHLLFTSFGDSTGGVWAVPFSLDRLEVTGEPFPVAEGAGSPISVSRDGTLVYMKPAPAEVTRLVLVDRQGRVVRPVGETQLEQRQPSVSPDGERVAVLAGGEQVDIWINEVSSGSRVQLTFDKAGEVRPTWTSTGAGIGYGRWPTLMESPGIRRCDIRVAAADGSGEATPLLAGSAPSFSLDGRFVVYLGKSPGLGDEIWYAPLDEQGRAGEPKQVLDPEGNDLKVGLSPNGKFLVYASLDSGLREVYVTRFPSADGKWQVSREGGTAPVWSPKGDRIFFQQGQDLMEVTVGDGPSPQLSRPRKLFTWRAIDRGFDVTPDGQQFVMIEEVDPGAARPQIAVVQNWSAEYEGPR